MSAHGDARTRTRTNAGTQASTGTHTAHSYVDSSARKHTQMNPRASHTESEASARYLTDGNAHSRPPVGSVLLCPASLRAGRCPAFICFADRLIPGTPHREQRRGGA
eukprot:6174243-Pleurochrysis_carterae.AAC.3